MTLVDYASNFWGDKHIGYNVLYDNMKKGEESVQEFLHFLKERISMEDDLLKSIGKSLHRVNGYVSSNGNFVDAWKLAKGTLELWTEIQSKMVKNLNTLLREATRYQEELARMRKRAKDVDTLETINLMQTTSTCLQKARETYNQRCTEVVNLKQNNKEWTAASTKEYLKARNRLNKAHEEYRQYMEKYAQIRDTFEERIVRAARSFQEHDRLHLLQMKRFFMQMAKYLEDGHNAHAQMSMNLCQNVEQHFDVEDVMLRFIDEKGTGSEPPQKFRWTEADEIPPELDVGSCVQSQSSSNSSAIIPNPGHQQLQPTANDLLGPDDTWMVTSSAVGGGTNSFSGSGSSFGVKGSGTGSFEHNKSGDSDSERHSEVMFPTASLVPSSLTAAGSLNPTIAATTSSSSSSYVPQQISSWRQKFSGPWRLKKHFSSSQSSLPGATANENGLGETNSHEVSQATVEAANFSKSYNDTSSKGGSSSLLKRYHKGKGIKSSVGDLTHIGKSQPELSMFASNTNDNPSIQLAKVHDPLQEFGPPPPLPTSEPPSLEEEVANAFGEQPIRFDHSSSGMPRIVASTSLAGPPIHQPMRHHSVSFASEASGCVGENQKRRWSTSSSSSDEEEIALAAQRSKIRQLQIRPLNDSQQSRLNASMDELRSAIGQISLQKSNTFENDPWAGGPSASIEDKTLFSNSNQSGIIRATLTGDEHLRRKFNFAVDPSEFSQSVAGFSAGSSIARARPRSHTPLPPKPYQTLPAASLSSIGQSPIKIDAFSTEPTPPRPIPPAQPPISIGGTSELTSTPHSFGTPSLHSFFTVSASPLTVPSTTIPSNNNTETFVNNDTKLEKIPIAMAINEYIHVWIKRGNASKPEIRLFGTMMFSLSSSSLAQLQSSTPSSLLHFSLQRAAQLKMIVPNKMFIENVPNANVSRECHHFIVERDKMANFLQECVRQHPQAAFHNADLLRYELPVELAPSSLPLTFTSQWTRLPDADGVVELRIDYKYSKIDEIAPQNVAFNTKISTQSGDCLGISLLGSEPPAKWIAEQSVLSWEFREMPSIIGGRGQLKAKLKCIEELVPTNTYVQFQLPDQSLSGAQIHLEDSTGYALSVFRRKLLAGKYFCEPSF